MTKMSSPTSLTLPHPGSERLAGAQQQQRRGLAADGGYTAAMRLVVPAATLAAILLADPTAAKDRRRPPPAEAHDDSPPASGPLEFWAGRFALADADDPTFKPGQVWRFRTRPTEPRSRVVICRVESAARRGTIVHVQVTGIRIRKRATVLGALTTVDHLPITREALVTSVTTIEREDQGCKDFDAPYAQWRREFLSGSGKVGVYAAPVAESLDFLERSLRPGNATAQ